MKANDVMTAQPVWCCGEESSVREVAEMMDRHNVGCIIVCDSQGKVSGIVTDRDICCRLVARGGSFDTPIREIASQDVHCAMSDTDLGTVESVMRTHKVRRMPVVDRDRRVQGVISLSDIAHHCGSVREEHEVMVVFETITLP